MTVEARRAFGFSFFPFFFCSFQSFLHIPYVYFLLTMLTTDFPFASFLVLDWRKIQLGQAGWWVFPFLFFGACNIYPVMRTTLDEAMKEW
jgi:hypothetical protein